MNENILNVLIYLAMINSQILMNTAPSALDGAVTPTNILKEYLVGMARQITANLTPEDRLKYIMEASKCENKKEADGMSRFFLSFGAEMIISSLNGKDVPVKEQFFAVKKGVSAIAGETIEFINGKSTDGYFYTASKNVNGIFVISIDRFGNTFAKATVATVARQWIKKSIEKKLVVFKVRNDGKLNVKREKKSYDFKTAKNSPIFSSRQTTWVYHKYSYDNPSKIIAVDLDGVKIEVLLSTPINKGNVGSMDKMYDLSKIKIDHIQDYNGINYIFGTII